MKQLIDFIPLIIFFALYKMQDIYVATGALVVATAIQVITTYFVYKKVEKLQIVTFLIVAVFGGMTILLHDDNFIKWKVTLVYSLFAIGLGISHLIGKSAIKSMLGKELTLPDPIWAKVTWAWVIFFSICAAVNLYVAYTLPLDIWVNFKVFGLLAATVGFTLVTGLFIYKHVPKEDSDD